MKTASEENRMVCSQNPDHVTKRKSGWVGGFLLPAFPASFLDIPTSYRLDIWIKRSARGQKECCSFCGSNFLLSQRLF